MVEFKSLVGEHVLDAVDRSNETIKHEFYGSEQCEVIRFRLDGVVYVAMEDPEDGYRSCMRDLVTEESEMKNVFPPVRVMVRHRTDATHSGWPQVDDVLEFICIENGKEILTVGTENTDDYYPSFVGDFRPENMPVNA